MRQRTGLAVSASVSVSRTQRRNVRSVISALPTLLIIIVLIASTHVTIGIGPKASSDVMEGDAPNSSECRQKLKQQSTQAGKCNIARGFEGCSFDSGFFNYLQFQYCQFPSTVIPTILMVLWLFVLLGAFAVIADSFFSPSLIALARSMHMSQNLAGVTLLAFGNGAPDVFSAVTAITTGDPSSPDEGLGLGFLMGSGLLVNTVTAGLIMIIRPFKTNRRPFIKDVLFYMSAVTWSAVILIRRTIYLSDSIGFILLYILYVITTWGAGHVRLKRSNSEAYQRCANFLKSLKVSMICKRKPPESQCQTEATENPPSSKVKWRFPSLWTRFRGHFKTRSTEEDVLRDSDNSFSEKEVRIIGFHKLSDPMSISKSASSRNGGHHRPPLCFPRIEVTSPPADGNNTVGGGTLSKSSSMSTRRDHLAPPRDLLEPPQRHGHVHPLTPPPPRTSHHPVILCATPPSSVSRRGSAVGGPHSIATGSSIRKRASVGGIGLRSRTPSTYQRRGSRRMSNMEQLPFVVRWIIANEEAESREYDEAQMDESARDIHWKRNLEMRKRYRNISDSTHAGDVSFSQDFSQSRSPTVSFLDEHSDRAYFSHLHHGGKTELQRISSVSLPDLDDIDKARGKHLKGSSSHGSIPSICADGVRGSHERIGSSVRGSQAEEASEAMKSKEAEEEDEEDMEYVDPFVKWASSGMWHHLLYCLCPVEISEWHDLSIPVKIIQIIQAPVFLLFRLTIPVVYEDLEPIPSQKETEVQFFEDDNEPGAGNETNAASPAQEGEQQSRAILGTENPSRSGNDASEDIRSYGDSTLVDLEDLHGWCRLLNCFQCLITPMLWVLLITVGGIPLGLYKVGSSNLPVVVIIILISTCLAITIFVTSRWDRAPTPYHRPFFATLGFFTSVVWIYAIAQELVNSLEALGIVWEISEAILGTTVMAFANSISDLMSNSLLAYNGYPRIGYAACIGSPLFNLLLGAGVSYTIKLARSEGHSAAMSFTLTHVMLFSFLIGVLITDIIVAFATGFQMRRAYGICLLCTYAVFLVLAILVEADIITPPSQWNLMSGLE